MSNCVTFNFTHKVYRHDGAETTQNWTMGSIVLSVPSANFSYTFNIPAPNQTVTVMAPEGYWKVTQVPYDPPKNWVYGDGFTCTGNGYYSEDAIDNISIETGDYDPPISGSCGNVINIQTAGNQSQGRLCCSGDPYELVGDPPQWQINCDLCQCCGGNVSTQWYPHCGSVFDNARISSTVTFTSPSPSPSPSSTGSEPTTTPASTATATPTPTIEPCVTFNFKHKTYRHDGTETTQHWTTGTITLSVPDSGFSREIPVPNHGQTITVIAPPGNYVISGSTENWVYPDGTTCIGEGQYSARYYNYDLSTINFSGNTECTAVVNVETSGCQAMAIGCASQSPFVLDNYSNSWVFDPSKCSPTGGSVITNWWPQCGASVESVQIPSTISAFLPGGPTPTPESTHTPAPTSTPVPTSTDSSTPVPTATPFSTATPGPTPDVSSVIIDKKYTFLKYHGEYNQISNLTGYANIKTIYKILEDGSFTTWSYTNSSLFNGFNHLENNKGYFIISKTDNPNYELYTPTTPPSEEIINNTMQIVRSECSLNLSENSNKFRKVYGVDETGLNYVTFDRNQNSLFNSLNELSPGRSYLVLSDANQIPYQLCVPSIPSPTPTPTENENIPIQFIVSGESTNLQLGHGTKLSPNGEYLTVKTTSGIRVYKNTSGTWAQLGSEITGNSHYSPSISNNGRVVFGEPYSTKNVYVYEYNGSSWVQVYTAITTGESGFGQFVAISNDGSRIAVASHNSSWTGSIMVFQDTGSSWQQIGQTMTGTYGYFDGKERLGATGVQFSSDGSSILASGYGVIRVFDYNGSLWNQRAAIDRVTSTESGITTFGNYSSGNSDLTRIVAGQYGFEGINPTPTPTPPIPLGAPTGLGKVMIYDWDSGNNTYVLSQTIIPNFNQASLFGHATSITEDGSTIAVGGYLYNKYAGICSFYHLSNGLWVEMYSPLTGTQSGKGTDPRFEGGRLGYQVSLAQYWPGVPYDVNHLETIVAISEPNYEVITDPSQSNFTSYTIAGRVKIRKIQ